MATSSKPGNVPKETLSFIKKQEGLSVWCIEAQTLPLNIYP